MRLAFLTLSLLLVQLIPPAASGQDFSLEARQTDFKTFVRDFEDRYAYLDRPDKPWLTWEARYGLAVEQASTKEAFDAVLALALSELHDFHAEVRSRVVDRWLPVPTFDDVWAAFSGDCAIVQAVRQGSDAERAGISAGDQITRIGTKTLDQALDERLGSDMKTATPEARQWALLSVLTGRADESRSFSLKNHTGTDYAVTLPVERRFERASGALSDKRLPGNIGLIRFNNSLGDQRTVAAFDEALYRYRDTTALILDLRDVPSGGDSSVALGIMGRFVSELLAYQRHRIPGYGQADVERNWVEFVTPRGPFTYRAPVVILVDHWTGSMGEGMAVGFDAMHRAVVVGTPMAHLAGAVSDDKLPRTGVDVAYATEQIYHVDGTPRQNWIPPVLVSEQQTNSGNDVILARGIAALHKNGQRATMHDLSLRPPK